MTYKKTHDEVYFARNSPVEIKSFLQVAEKIAFYAKILLSWW
jgi:hypothetical protein